MTWSTVDEAVVARGRELVAKGDTPEMAAEILRGEGCKVSGRTLRRRLAEPALRKRPAKPKPPKPAPEPTSEELTEADKLVADAADKLATAVLADVATLDPGDAATVTEFVARLRGLQDGHEEPLAEALEEIVIGDLVLVADVVWRLLGRQPEGREVFWIADVLRSARKA